MSTDSTFVTSGGRPIRTAARIGFLSLHLAPAATPLAYLQPATDISERFVGVQFTSEVVVALSVEQAATLRSDLDRVLLAAELAVEVTA